MFILTRTSYCIDRKTKKTNDLPRDALDTSGGAGRGKNRALLGASSSIFVTTTATKRVTCS